ncbi:hypothetical protein BG004_004180 [Podila humilis]|nr:hypothetical protein BG004_004180 [Podila humilis]
MENNPNNTIHKTPTGVVETTTSNELVDPSTKSHRQPTSEEGSQFQQSYQPPSFFSQPEMSTAPHTASSSSTDPQAFNPVPSSVPVNTNSRGDGAPGFHVGDFGVPGAKVDLMDDVMGSYPAPVGPFDQPSRTTETAVAATPTSAGISPPLTPIIQIQREDSMRGHPTPPLPGQYNPGHTVTYDDKTLHHDGGNSNIQMATYSSFDTNTSESTSTSRPKVHIASESVVETASKVEDDKSRGRRRSSLAVLTEKFRSSMSRSRSRSGSRSRGGGSGSSVGERSPSLSRRLSRTFSRSSVDEEEEVGGPYADVKLAQQEYIAKLRAEQERNHITTNADGLPIPPPSSHQRRRSSVTHILGLDKPLLSR